MNIPAFINSFQNTLSVFLFFLVALAYLDEENKIIKIIYVLFFGILLDFIFQFLIYFEPEFFSKIGYAFIHSRYMDLIAFNIQRGRIYFELYDEALIPLIFYFMLRSKKILEKISLNFFYFTTGFFAFVSNFRTKFLMFLFGSILPVCFYVKKWQRQIFNLLLVFLILIFFINNQFDLFSGSSIIERFSFQENFGEKSTVSSRIDRWMKTVEIGSSSLLLGVGLGNYYDYLSLKEQKIFAISPLESTHYTVAARHPHNIFFAVFAETGFFGLMSFTIIILYFLAKDISLIFKINNDISKAFICSFWTLFIFSLLNPTSTIKYNILFWSLRIFIERTAKSRA